MQAPATLSHHQQESLLKTYTFMLGLSGLLDGIEQAITRPDDRLVLDNLRQLAAISQRDLLEAFPELHQWLDLWKRGGVS